MGKRCKVLGYAGKYYAFYTSTHHHATHTGEGTIRFYGEDVSKGVVKVGIEMDDAVGKNDGKVGRLAYLNFFRCNIGVAGWRSQVFHLCPKTWTLYDPKESVYIGGDDRGTET